jgi:hypothetical protein
MAMSDTHSTRTIAIPRWPTAPFDPSLAWVDYDVGADEFLIFFGGKPVPAISDILVDAPGFNDVAVMLALDKDRRSTDEIVGVQVIPMLLGAVQEQPHWAILTWAAMAGDYGTELLKERLPGFLDEVAAAFRQYWKPAPPIEEQMAEIERARQRREAAGGSETANATEST